MMVIKRCFDWIIWFLLDTMNSASFFFLKIRKNLTLFKFILRCANYTQRILLCSRICFDVPIFFHESKISDNILHILKYMRMENDSLFSKILKICCSKYLINKFWIRWSDFTIQISNRHRLKNFLLSNLIAFPQLNRIIFNEILEDKSAVLFLLSGIFSSKIHKKVSRYIKFLISFLCTIPFLFCTLTVQNLLWFLMRLLSSNKSKKMLQEIFKNGNYLINSSSGFRISWKLCKSRTWRELDFFRTRCGRGGKIRRRNVPFLEFLKHKSVYSIANFNHHMKKFIGMITNNISLFFKIILVLYGNRPCNSTDKFSNASKKKFESLFMENFMIKQNSHYFYRSLSQRVKTSRNNSRIYQRAKDIFDNLEIEQKKSVNNFMKTFDNTLSTFSSKNFQSLYRKEMYSLYVLSKSQNKAHFRLLITVHISTRFFLKNVDTKKKIFFVLFFSRFAIKTRENIHFHEKINIMSNIKIPLIPEKMHFRAFLWLTQLSED